MPRELLMMQNSFQWGTAEGQTLEIENAIKSNARGLKIEGQTYQNLLSETKSLRNFVYDDITGEYTLTDPTVDSWNSMSINYTRPIQAGEKLLIRINIVKNTIETTDVSPLKIVFSNVSNADTPLTGYVDVETGVTGLFEYYCDGASIAEYYKNKIEITTRAYTSGELVIKDIQVIPVSTNPLSYTELPTSIDGIESVAEREFEQNLYTEGDLNVKGKYAWMNTRKTINCKPNTNYTFSCNIESVNKGDYNANPFVEVYTNEKIYENRNVRLNEPGSASFTTNNEAKQLIIYFFVNNETYSSTECEANFKDIELYESDVYSIKIAQSNNKTDGITLPNGVKNTIENSVCIRKIGTYIITGNEAFTLRYENDSVIAIECRDLSIEIAFNDYWNSNVKMICDKAVCENCVMDTFVSDKLTTCSRTSSFKGFIIAIPKSLLTEYTIDKAKEYIKSLGGMTVYYELATPTTEPLTTTAISLPQPLRSLPNGVCDEVVGNKLIQRVGKYTCTGNETIVLEYNGGLARFKITIKNYKPNLQSIRRPVLSDKFTTATASENYVGLAFSYYACIYIYLEQTIKTVDSCKQWLLENKPTFYYELETPIVHEITQPIIPISKGGNIVTTINNIKPNLYIKYKKSKK